MRSFNFFILVLLLVVFGSCKKKIYPESTTEGAPVFNCSMNVNGKPISFEAGVDNYYMYSAFEQDSNAVYNFKAGLKQTGCSDCPNSIQIQINDFKVSLQNAVTKIDSSLFLGNYNYLASNAASFYNVQFLSNYNKPAASYLWNFGDGSTSTLANPNHIYKKNSKYKVALTVNGNSACYSSITSLKNIGVFNNAFNTSISDSSLSANTIKFYANNSQGVAPFSYLWNFGDATSASNLASPSHNYQFTGSYPVTLRVIDANNDTAYAKYNAVTQNDISSCAANYTLSTVSLSPNLLGLSNIVINWTDANGLLYSSKSPLQPNSSYFTVISVENFKNNDSNQLTKKLHVKFACTVYNGLSSITISNAHAIICVAYK